MEICRTPKQSDCKNIKCKTLQQNSEYQNELKHRQTKKTE